MKMIWKGLAALAITGSTLVVTAAPAQAQYYRDGYRDGYRGDNNRGWRDDRGRNWRGDRHYRNSWRGHDRRCWNEWRRGYHGQRVKVRICR